MLGVFLGAGFSKWAADLPLACELFDLDIVVRGEREEKRLACLQKDKAKWDLENPNGEAEGFVEWSLNKSSVRKSRVVWYLARRLSDPFIASILGGTQTLMINDRRARELEGVKRAQDFLRLVVRSDTAGIVTVNYDLLVEYSLSTNSFHYGVPGEHLTGRGHNPQFPWQNTPVTLTGKMPLAKLHGSLSWENNTRYTDGRCGLNGKALIVPPRAYKNGEEEMPKVWSLARTILSRSSRVVFFGFAFNPYDSHLLELLQTYGREIQNVALVDPFPPVARAQALWSGANISVFNPTSLAGPEFRDWLNGSS